MTSPHHHPRHPLPITWTGDLDDDCTAIWSGLMLRAEMMDIGEWWWAVSIDEPESDWIDSSDYKETCPSGEAAMALAEAAARKYIKGLAQDQM